jgi:ClpX C4-type zinc finger
MYVRWQQRKRTKSEFGRWREGDIHWSAVAVENKRINGKPTQRHIGYIVGFTESQAKIGAQRCHLWDHICGRLNQLGNQITAADRKQIEAAIAEKVQRPTSAEYKDIARGSAQRFGWKYLTEQQRTALQDEAEQWQGTKGNLAEKIRGAMNGSTEPVIRCSFCGKSAGQVHTMVAGADAHICDECVKLAATKVSEREALVEQTSKPA